MAPMVAGPRLVGRELAQATLSAALARADASVGQLVLLSGEPGIGKSALLAWLAAESGAATVLRGFCWEGPGAPPYWPWTQVLRASGLDAVELGEAGRLLDSGPHDRVEGAAAAADAQFRLLESVTAAVVALASRQPVVLLLDDLQWADRASLELLSFLVRATVAQPVLVVGAYRDAEAPPGLLGLSTSAVHVPLTGLTRPDVEELLGDLPGSPADPGLAVRVWERSGGNPFFVRELSRLLQSADSGQRAPHLPAEVVETVRRRLARLPTDCVRMLEWAAVAGREIDVDLVAACAGQAPAEVADQLALAASAGVVTGEGRPRFTHDLHREALLDGMAPGALTRAHEVVGRHLRGLDRPGSAGQVAAHLVAAGPGVRTEAVAACVLAAREATQRLGHEDACGHLERALALLDEEPQRRAELLLALAAARDRAGRRDAARVILREVAELALGTGDVPLLARAALGLQSLGARSGTQVTEVVHLLEAADRGLAATDGHAALRSAVLASLARARRHSLAESGDLIAVAEQAVALARGIDDPLAVATALLAQHDAMWAPGTAAARLDVVTEMLAAASAAGDRDLVAQARQLRATALLELGDPAGREELLAYAELAEGLGHARGRWAALTRRATYAQLAGLVEEAVRLGEEAHELGVAIGEPDAVGCFCTHRWSLAAFGTREPELPIDLADPLWPMFPLIRAWPYAARGEAAEARRLLGDFSVVELSATHDLERPAVAAVVFAVVGSAEQRRWAYDRLLPHAGTHVVVGGCAAYHGAVDHHLGALAAALGDPTAAAGHLREAVRLHARLGAAGWLRLSEQALAALDGADRARDDFRLDEGRWVLSYAGRRVSLPDAKGLQDLHTLLGSPGREVHVLELLGNEVAGQVGRTGADPVLDEEAKAQYRARLTLLTEELESAERSGDADRTERVEGERSALVRELAAATGLGGRDRRLGDASERARKTVGARLRDSLTKIDAVHPELAAHLRGSLHLGTTCVYRPDRAASWRLTS